MSTVPNTLDSPDGGPLRVMVVDDSLVLRGLISRMINDDPSKALVVASASNGQIAVDRVRKGDIDVVILDIEMPVMDGITALRQMLEIDRSIVVIMASTLTTRNAEISLKAIGGGAKDYIPKPSALTPGAGAEDFKRELLEKIAILGARYRRSSVANNTPRATDAAPLARKPTLIPLRSESTIKPAALAIGCSTGGPNALHLLLKSIRGPLPVPVFITQHMPPTFTAMLAENLTRDCGHNCKEAKDGETVAPGRIYIAPGDYHMSALRMGTNVVIKLNQGPKENFCRPAVDPMLRSLTEAYGNRLLAAILTGMGQDGLLGCEAVTAAGGNVLAQDEVSSVVWGMPGAVAKAGLACAVLPVPQLAARLSAIVER